MSRYTKRPNHYYTTTDSEEDSSYLTLSERIAKLSTSRVDDPRWSHKNNTLEEPFTYLKKKNGEIIYAQVVVDPNQEPQYDHKMNKYTVHRAFNDLGKEPVENSRKRSNASNNVTRVLLNSSSGEDQGNEPTSYYSSKVDNSTLNRSLRVNDFYKPERFYYEDDELDDDEDGEPIVSSSFSEWRSQQQKLQKQRTLGVQDVNNKTLNSPHSSTANNVVSPRSGNKKNLFSTLNKFFTKKNKSKKETYQSYQDDEKSFSNPTVVVTREPRHSVEKAEVQQSSSNNNNKVKRRWTIREGAQTNTNNINNHKNDEIFTPKLSQTLDSRNKKTNYPPVGGYNTLGHTRNNSNNTLTVPRYFKKGASSESENSTTRRSFKKDSSTGSRSVYLHDQTVIDQIPKMIGKDASRRTVSKDDVSISHSGQVRQSRQLSRSMSVVAPWGPNTNKKEYNYYSTTTLPPRPPSRSPRPGGPIVNRKVRKPTAVSSSIESLINSQRENTNKNLKRSKSFQQPKPVATNNNKFTNWFKRK